MHFSDEEIGDALDRDSRQAPRDAATAAGCILVAYIVVAAIAIAAYLLLEKEAEASPRRLAYIEKVQGLHEVKNRKTIQAMVGVRPDRIPWCGYMVAAVVKKTGGTPPSGYPRALAWKSFGRAVHLSNARKGDIVVFRTKRGYHVSIYSHRSKGRVCAVGGNQSNRIKLTCYRASTVKWVRR